MANRQLQVVLDLVDKFTPTIKSATKSAESFESTAKSVSNAVDNIEGKVNIDTSAAEEGIQSVENHAKTMNMTIDSINGNITIDADVTGAETKVKSVENAVENATKTETVKIDADTSAAESQIEGLSDQIDELKTATSGAATGIAGTAIVGGILSQDEAFAKLRSQVQGYNQDLANSATKIYQVSGADWDQVIESTATLTNQQGLLGGELESSSVKAIGFANAFGADLVNTITANTNIVKNFGISSAEGFDIMTATAQASGREIGDVVDTFVEYTPQFAALGYSAQDMGNLLASASHHGVRNLDEFADAFKEFTIRVTTSSSDAAKGFAALGASTDQQKKWTAAIKEGGPAAKQATQEIVQSIMSIQDPVKRNEAGVALFGTKWEDLRGAIGDSMMDGQSYLGDFEGRADEVANNTSSSMLGSFELWLRGINPIFGSALDTITPFAGEVALIMGSMAGSIITARLASAGATGVDTAAENTNMLAKIKNKAASISSMITTYSSAAARDVAVGAAMAHAGAIEVSTAAENQGVIAKVRGTASTIASTVATGARTVATNASAAAQWALNAAMDANPIMIVVLAVMVLVGALWYLYNTNESVRNSINWVFGGLTQLYNLLVEGDWVNAIGLIENSFSTVGQGIGSSLSNIGGIIWTALQGAGQAIWNFIVSIPSMLAGAATSYVNMGSSIIDWIIQGLTSIADSLTSSLDSMLTDSVTNAVTGTGPAAANGGQQAGQAAGGGLIDGFMQWIQQNGPKIAATLQKEFTVLLPLILQIIGTIMVIIALSLWNWASKAGSDFVRGLGQWFMNTLPGKILAWLALTIVKIVLWSIQMQQKAKETGSKFLIAIISYVLQLPGKLWTYFLLGLARIALFASQAVGKARQVGSNIVNTIKDYLTKLPGNMYTWGMNALNKFVNGIIDTIPGLRGALDMVSGLFPHSPPKEGPLSTIKPENMYKFGQDLADNFSNGINDNTGNVFSNLGNLPEVPTAQVATAATISPSVDATALTDSVATANTQYTLLQSTSTNTLLNMANTTKSTFNNMKNSMQGTLNTIVADNKKGYNTINTTTKSTLSSLKSQTGSSINAVKTSWNGMRNGLVNAAQNIKTNVSSDISKLSSNIGTFYRKIRNPSLLIAGPGPGFAGPGNISLPRISGNFAGPSNSSELNLLDNAPYIPCVDCYAGGWDVSSPNISSIMSRVKGYVPSFGDYGSFGLKAKDFTNNTFPIRGNLSAFTSVADKAISGTHYKFYYNSAYASPAAALNAGQFNCWDGAMIIGALANAFNLPWELIHGFWNNVGHVWARVMGRDYDTTAKQHGYGWTSPKVRVAGPVPSLRDSSSGNSDPIKIELEENVNINVKLEGVPDNMDEANLIAVLKKIITDSGVIKKLVKNEETMELIIKGLSKDQRWIKTNLGQ